MKSFILFACLISSVASATPALVSAEETKREENLSTEESKVEENKAEEGKTEEAQQEVKAH